VLQEEEKDIRTRALRVAALSLPTALTVLVAELALWRLEPRIGHERFELLRRATAESFYFIHYDQAQAALWAPGFDRTLGWRNAPWKSGKRESVNADAWRSTYDFEVRPSKRRVIVTGDSFVYGWLVDDSETIPAYLERELGPGAEVLNMAARGYGLDQMALVATSIAPRYQPEAIVIAFIADDLRRSCYDFNFNLKKPHFVWQGNNVVPAGIPVASPQETLARHLELKQRLADRLITFGTRSRLACLAGQFALQREHARCLTDLNAAILNYVVTRTSPAVKKFFVHLDGTLPAGFEAKVRELPAVYVSAPSHVARISAESGVSPERQPDGHPAPALNRIYGRVIADALSAAIPGAGKSTRR
jgi:hypothetical protein